jgi:SAM-dependent methyltransferase
VKTSLALQFLHRVLGLEHLHYGLWEASDPRTREGLERAQERYARRLVALVPDGARRVLDVGAGVGTTALRLLERGVDVEGLSPDPYQQRVFEQRVGRPFHLGRFQEFEPAAAYDLVLMSESAQYIWLDSLFPAVLRATRRGGWLLVADYFVLERDGSELTRSGHLLEAFLEGAAACGLVLEHREDITEEVLPTLELGTSWIQRYVEPAVALLDENLEARHRWLHRIVRRVVRGRVEWARQGMSLLDAEAFRRTKRYELLRFRVDG